MKRYDISKMLSDGNTMALVNGAKRILIKGLSKNAVAAYDYNEDKMIVFDLEKSDIEKINSYKRTNFFN